MTNADRFILSKYRSVDTQLSYTFCCRSILSGRHQSESSAALPQSQGECCIKRLLRSATFYSHLLYDLQGEGPERLVSGSDDFTLFLWKPAEEKKPVSRLTGHQALVNEVLFSPDTRLLASASFDKSIKIWDGRTGK